MSDQLRRSWAIEDFRRARQQAAVQQVLARLSGRPLTLLTFDAVTRYLKPTGSSERGLQEIPLDAIAGSVGRSNDFTRDFLPIQDSDQDRWARVRSAAADPHGGGLPPIKVYQVGEAYFVIDGHHRVSVARQMGATHIQAYVTEVRTKAPLSAQATPEEVIVKSEYVNFLEEMGFDQARPGVDLSVTAPGAIEQLRQQIRLHQADLEHERGQAVPRPAAAADWYEAAYLPVLSVIRQRGTLREFPGRTEADVYVLISAHRAALQDALGWEIAPEVGALDLAAKQGAQRKTPIVRAGQRLVSAVIPDELLPGPATGQWRRAKMAARYSDHLFGDILVPVNGEPGGWQALDQALQLAQREDARVHGLYVVASSSLQAEPAAEAVRTEFNQRCRAAGIPGSLAVETGAVPAKICERAALADIVVLNLAHPPRPPMLARLGSGFRTTIRLCPRPVLAVPETSLPLERVLLAYDGSAKAEEALFVAAYFAEAWELPLVVVTVKESGAVSDAQVGHARAYLEMHEVEASYLVHDGGGVAKTILAEVEALASSLVVMGGYGTHPVVEAVLGSVVEEVLRRVRRPTLICQ